MGKTKTVLIVDNHLTTRRMLRFALELQDHCVIEAADRTAALAALNGNRVDLLLIGLSAADDQAGDLVPQVRHRPDGADLPILLVGSRSCRERDGLRAFSNCAWLDKPLRMSEIHSAVESLLGSSALPAAHRSAAKKELRHV